MNTKDLEDFTLYQLSTWELARKNFEALSQIQQRKLAVGGMEVILQHNPARIASSVAEIDKKSIQARSCFLCRENRLMGQDKLELKVAGGENYDILLNPYPIFDDHLVMAKSRHCDQEILLSCKDLIALVSMFEGYTVFYNGPFSGASAPDHHHFQATHTGRMPLENEIDRLLDQVSEACIEEVPFTSRTYNKVRAYKLKKYIRGIYVLVSRDDNQLYRVFRLLMDRLPRLEGEKEARVNVFCSKKNGEFRLVVISRTSHRSSHFYSKGSDHLTMSPGTVDMAGLFICPIREDYDKLDDSLLEEMLNEVTPPSDFSLEEI